MVHWGALQLNGLNLLQMQQDKHYSLPQLQGSLDLGADFIEGQNPKYLGKYPRSRGETN